MGILFLDLHPPRRLLVRLLRVLLFHFHIRLCHTQLVTYNFVTYNFVTYNLSHTLCHIQLCYIQLCHTQLCHIQLCHLQLCHIHSKGRTFSCACACNHLLKDCFVCQRPIMTSRKNPSKATVEPSTKQEHCMFPAAPLAAQARKQEQLRIACHGRRPAHDEKRRNIQNKSVFFYPF